MISQLGCKRIDLPKIDMERYKLSVLVGAMEALSAKITNFIYLKTGLETCFVSLPSFIEKLSPLGYSKYGIYELTPQWTSKQNS